MPETPPVLPVAAYDPTSSVIGRSSILSITVGSTVTNLLVNYVSHDPGLEMGESQAPGANNGPAFTDRVWEKARKELFKFKTKEIKKVIALLGSLSGSISGTCTAWIRDPNDAPAKVALKTDDFPCTIYRDTGEAALSGDNPSEVTLVIRSQKDGAVDIRPDVAFTPPGGTPAPDTVVRSATVTVANTITPDGVAHITVQAKNAAGGNVAARVPVEVFLSATSYGAPTALGTLNQTLVAGTLIKVDTADAAFSAITDANGLLSFTYARTPDGDLYAMAQLAGISAVGHAAITGNGE
jgi:hypothetical protein